MESDTGAFRRCGDRRQQHRAPDADVIVSRHQRHDESGQAHEQQRRDQRRLAADAIAVVPKMNASMGLARKPTAKIPNACKVPTSGSELGKYSLANTSPVTAE